MIHTPGKPKQTKIYLVNDKKNDLGVNGKGAIMKKKKRATMEKQFEVDLLNSMNRKQIDTDFLCSFLYLIHRLQIRQWCARGGRYVSHLVHTVHSSSSRYRLLCALCKSEKSNRMCGNGTIPGSQKTAFKCEMVNRKTMVLNKTTLIGPQRLK